jgi:hypothetical protein
LAGNADDIRLAYTLRMKQPEEPSLAGYRVAVAAARKAQGDRHIIATVVKRGYRLAIDESFGAA